MNEVPIIVTAVASAIAAGTLVIAGSTMLQVRSTLSSISDALRLSHGAVEGAIEARQTTVKLHIASLQEIAQLKRYPARFVELLKANNEYLDRARTAERTVKALTEEGKRKDAALDYLINSSALTADDLEFGEAPDEIKKTIATHCQRHGLPWRAAA